MRLLTIKIITVLSFFICINTAHAQFSLGVLGHYSQSIYKDTGNTSLIVPLISNDIGQFFIKDRGVGYHLSDYLDISINYKDPAFNPDNSSNADIKKLDERKETVIAKAVLNAGIFKASIEQDISGRHDGYAASVGLGIPFITEQSYTIIGAVKYTYVSQKMSNYLYSVSATESSRTSGNIPEYTSPSTNKTDYSIQFVRPINKKATLVTVLSHTRYSKEVTISPIVERDSSNGLTVIFSYNF